MNLVRTTLAIATVYLASSAVARHPLTVFAETQAQEKIQVASIIERSLEDESDIPNLPVTDEYIIETSAEDANENPSADPMAAEQSATRQIVISVRKAWETGEASVYVNHKEALRFRNSVAGFTPYERAQIVAQRLYKYLIQDGKPEDIKPDTSSKWNIIRAGDELLVTVDEETAKSAKNNPRHLAYIWGNLLRTSLGAAPVAEQPVANYRSTGKLQRGVASWYGGQFHGRRTASGSRFNMYALTAAHRTLPFGTLVKVSNQRTGKSCVVKITDRGPYAHGRIIDLSKAAAQAIGMSGVAKVTLEVVNRS